MDSQDREILRSLAGRWMELASLPVMAERVRLWTALKDLRAERPMVLFETASLQDYFSDEELQCGERGARDVERQMRWTIRQAEEVGDDFIVEPCWRVPWHIESSDYGVPLVSHHATDVQGGNVAYVFEHPICTPEDIDRLKPRTWRVDRERTAARVEDLSAAFGDILPVVSDSGWQRNHAGLTQTLFKLAGNDNLLTWTYDAPEALHRLMAFLRDDLLAYYRWLESEELLGLNNIWCMVGSGSPGYTTALPQPDYAGTARLRDVWVWSESQETVGVSPGMFARFFLPYMAEVANMFGLVYYGCCEPVHDRIDRIRQAIPNVRAVSVSPWCDMQKLAEAIGRECVFSRKPWAAPISGPSPDWDRLTSDVEETVAAARGCNLEFIFRDVYRINGDRPRLRKWVEMVRSKIE